MRGQQTAKEEYADQIQKDQDQEKKKYHKTVNIYKKSWIECCWENDTAQSHRRHRHCLVSALYLSLIIITPNSAECTTASRRVVYY